MKYVIIAIFIILMSMYLLEATHPVTTPLNYEYNPESAPHMTCVISRDAQGINCFNKEE